MSSSDEFDDFNDDDVDFNEVFKRADYERQIHEKPGEVLSLRGENAILRAQLEQMAKKNEDENDKLRQRYTGQLKQHESKIKTLEDTMSRFKEENEFLASENKTLTRTRKKRKLDSSPLRSQSSRLADSSPKKTALETSDNQTTQIDEPTKVAIVTQATIFQDEKMLFIESIASQSIAGLNSTTFECLSRISSSFSYQYKDFQVNTHGESIKTSIVNYLIGFENKNRIDLLLTDFIEILLKYVVECLEKDRTNDCDGAVLLPIPYLLSLIRFSLDYRPKAISLDVIRSATLTISYIVGQFEEILKQDRYYLSIDEENEGDKQKESDFPVSEKTMHVKILEVFTACYAMDILEVLSKVAVFSESYTGDDKSLQAFWKSVPQEIIGKSLSVRTPAIFVNNAIEILANSITENAFAFWHDPKCTMKDCDSIFESLITLLDEGGPPELNISIYGLNRAVGSNTHTKLLEMLTPTSGVSWQPVTHSSDVYKKIIDAGQRTDPQLALKIQLKVLQMFELYLSYDRSGQISTDVLCHLVSAMVSMLGKQHEHIIRAPRSTTIRVRMDVVSTIVRLIHFLVSAEGALNVEDLDAITLRELIVALVRISADSLKNISIEYLSKLRMIEGFKGHVFNEQFERDTLERFGLLDDVDSNETREFRAERTQAEVTSSNGLEINYDDETIDMSRDVIGQCITVDEADALHYSINYDVDSIGLR